MAEIGLQISQGSPGHEVGRQTAFAVIGEYPFDFRQIACRMKRRGEMAAVAESKPFRQLNPIKMESEEVLEVMEGKEEVRDACSFSCVMVGTLLVIPVVKVEVGPNFDGGFFCSPSASCCSGFSVSQMSPF